MNVAGSSTFEDAKLVLLSPWGTTGLVLALVAAVAAVALTAWGYRRRGRWSVRTGLVMLRLLSVAALLAVVLQPAVQLRSVTRVPNHVALLLDGSRSMAIREERGGPSRVERAAALVRRSQDRLAAWRRQRVVDLFSFGAAVRPLVTVDELQATAPATQMQSALTEVRRRYRGQDLGGVILVSDGIDNATFGTGQLSPAALAFLQRLQVPVHTVWVGRPEIRDLALSEVYADDFAFVRNAVQVEAELSVHGLDEVNQIPVTLSTGSVTVSQRTVRLKRGVTRYRVQFEFVPPRVGKYVYTISTPIFAGEALQSNNSRDFLLKVIRDRVRVLQVCGRPSWDERFLRELLKRDPNVDLISFFILRTPADLALVPPTELSLIPFPTEELFEKELGSFDLIVLQNFNYKPYGIGVYLPHLRRYVEQGGGMVMIGGDLSFTSGEYADTPIAEVLPVRLLPDQPDRSRLFSVEDFRPRITPEGADHAILQVGSTRRETQQILAGLPALAGANLVAGPTPGATVLATHPTLKGTDGGPMPVLACAEPGSGRSCALTTDTSWHWAFLATGAGGSRQPYDRFWRNAIRWMIQDPELKYLRVIVQQDTVRLGGTIRATIRAYNPDYTAARGLKVAYEVEHTAKTGGRRGVARQGVTDNEGEVRVEHRPSAVGPYRIHASAELAGRQTSEDALVLVEPAGPEEREPRATAVVLKQIAAATGGRYLGPASRLPALAFLDPRVLHVNWRKDVELWSRWWSFCACVLLLGLEWLVRRRYGYL